MKKKNESNIFLQENKHIKMKRMQHIKYFLLFLDIEKLIDRNLFT